MAKSSNNTMSRSEILSGIASVAEVNPERANYLYNQYQRFQQDPSSPIYNAYAAPTNRAISNLQQLGFDTSKLNDNWFAANQGWIRNNLEYRGRSNSPSAPLKNSTKNQRIAYELYQYDLARERTKQADEEYNKIIQTAQQYAQWDDRNYSDEEIIKKVRENFEKDYPTLYEMEHPGLTTLELNHGYDFSDDVLRGAIWMARNPDQKVSLEYAMVKNYLGEGNQWKEDPDKTAKLTLGSDAYNPYDVGSTMEKECLFFNRTGFDKQWLDDNYERYYVNGTEEEKENYKKVWDQEEQTSMAEKAVSALELWKSQLKVTDPEKAQQKFDALLDSGKLYIKTDKNGNQKLYTTPVTATNGSTVEVIDLNVLNKMDKSIGKGDQNATGELLGMNRRIGYKYGDFVAGLAEQCEKNKSVKTDADDMNDIIDGVTKRENPSLNDVFNMLNGDQAPAEGTAEMPTAEQLEAGMPNGRNSGVRLEADRIAWEESERRSAEATKGKTLDELTTNAINVVDPNKPQTEDNKTNAVYTREMWEAEEASRREAYDSKYGEGAYDKAIAEEQGKKIGDTASTGKSDLFPKYTEAEMEDIQIRNEKISDAAETLGDVLTEDEAAVMNNAGSVLFYDNKDRYTAIMTDDEARTIFTDKAVQSSTKNMVTTGFENLHGIEMYRTAEANLGEWQKEFDEYKEKYGDVELLQRNFEPEKSVQIGDFEINMVFNEAENAYQVMNIYAPGRNVTYDDILEYAEQGIGWASEIINQANEATVPETQEALQIRSAHERIEMMGDQAKNEVDRYKQLVPAIQHAEEYLATNKDTYEKQNAAMQDAANEMYNMLEAAEILGRDTAPILETIDFLEGIAKYYYEPSLPVQANTKLDAIDIAAGFIGEDWDREQKSKMLQNGIKQDDEEIKKINDQFAFAEEHGYEIPDYYQKHMRQTLQDLENDKKAYEYSLILTETDPEELDKAIKAGEEFEKKFDQDFIMQCTGYKTLNNQEWYTDGLGGEVVSDNDKKVYYYLLGKKVLEMGDALEEDLSQYNSNLNRSSTAAIEVMSDAMDYYKFMRDENSGYGLWSNKEADKIAGYSKELTDSGTLGTVAANAMSTLVTPAESLANAWYALETAITGRRFSTETRAGAISGFKKETREETFNKIDKAFEDNPVAKYVARLGYEIYVNRGDSLMNSITFGGLVPSGGIFGSKFGSMLGEFAGATPMGISAGVNAALEAVENGATTEQAWAMLGATFIAETATEAITLSNIKEALGATEGLTKDTLMNAFKNWITKDGLEEMFGETLNDVVENWADTAIANMVDNPNYQSEHQRLVDYYMSQGFTGEGEADQKALEQELKGYAHTAFVSFLSAGTNVGLRTVKSSVNTVHDILNGYRGYTKAMQKRGYSKSMLGYMTGDAKKLIKGDRNQQTALDATERTAPIAEQETEQNTVQTEEKKAITDNTKKAAVAASAAAVSKRNGITSQTEAIAAILDNGDGDGVASDQASAAAAYLPNVVGDRSSVVVMEVMTGVANTDISKEDVTTALQYAALGNGAATRMMQTDMFKNATPEQKARMLVSTIEQDQSNPEVQQNVAAKVKDFRTTMQMNDLAANGHFDQAKADRAAAVEATRATAEAQTEAESRTEAAQAANNAATDINNRIVNEGATDDNLKEQNHALDKVQATEEVEKQAKQHLDKTQKAQQEAEAKADQSRKDAYNSAKQIADQKNAEIDQQREQTAFEKAEAERLAREQAEHEKAEAAQRQAEEDERTGKAEEDRRNSLIEEMADEKGLEGEERDAYIEEAKDQADKIKIRIKDLNKPVNNTEGALAVEAFSRKLGIPIRLSDLGPVDSSKIVRGKYENGVIYLNQNLIKAGKMTVGQALVEASLHEIVHSMENTKSYKSFRNVVMESVFGAKNAEDAMDLYNNNNAFRSRVDTLIQERKNAGDKNFIGNDLKAQVEAAEKEIVADFARMNLAEKDVVERFMDAGLGGKMRNTLHNINQALKNYFSNLTGEDRQIAEYLRKAERAFQKAMNEVTKNSVHPDGSQFSIMQFAQATGMTFNEKTLQLFDQNGKEIDGVNNKVTPEMMDNTPVGMLINSGLEGKQQKDAKEMMAGLMNMVARYKDSNLVWEIGATTLSSTFSALKSNSDPQYKTTVDFGTVCAKTQAIIDTMSQVMLDRVKEGKNGGLDRKDIMKVYNAVNKAGLSVPCPVCYVFSRWMGVPSLLGQMSQYQHDFVTTAKDKDGNTLYDKNGNVVINKEETQKNVDKYLRNAEENYGDAKAINSKKTSLQNKRNALEEKRIELVAQSKAKGITEEQRTDFENQISNVLDQMVELDKQIGEVSAYNWITQALCKKTKDGKYVVDDKFTVTPDEILFDLNRTGEFAGYEKNWRYRNTRGAGMGKAIMPYSGETIGDVLYGVKKGGRQNSIKNPWLNLDPKSAARQLKDARNRAKKQNLVGGQRLQSTSDFRPEWGLDYIMSFLELQAAGSKVQMYTKVAEAVDFFASVGADVNLSIMGKGRGWREATAKEIAQMTPEQKEAATIDGKVYMLEFSDVTGMPFYGDKKTGRKGAIDYKNQYDNVQMILVGMNDTHIRLALANSDIDFVIPWHSSGNSKEVLAGLISAVGEKLDSSVDYTTTQSDMVKGTVKKYTDENGNKVEYKVPGEQTADEKALWDARMKLLTKGGESLTQAERDTLLANDYTRELYKRFTQKGVDDECYGVKLSKEQASQIFPYEYWQTDATKPGGTKETADENGKRFVEYCEAMGIVPRFSQFKDDPGYWKLLIDRPMYNNDGSYHSQQVIDVTNAKIGALNDEGKLTDSDLPTQAQAKYAPKDPRSANYEKYTEAQKQAVENAEADINAQYNDGAGQNSVYGDLTEADMDLMSDVSEDQLHTLLSSGVITSDEFDSYNTLINQGEGQFSYSSGGYSDTDIQQMIDKSSVSGEYNGSVSGMINDSVSYNAKDGYIKFDNAPNDNVIKNLETIGMIYNPTQRYWADNGPRKLSLKDIVKAVENGNIGIASTVPTRAKTNHKAENNVPEMTSAEISQAEIDAGVAAPLEGMNPTMSTAQGTKVRAFAAEDGMLQDADQLDNFAKVVTTAQNTYFPDTNEDQVIRAIKWVRSLKQTKNSDGYAEALAKVTEDDFDYRSADGQARMVAVMALASAKNDTMAQAALADAFMRQGTDLGRALQARKLFKLMTPEGRISTLMKTLNQYKADLKKNGNGDIELQFSDWVLQAAAFAETEADFRKVQEAAAVELADQLPVTWKERLQGLRMLSMLGNPRTHVRNFIGNALFVPAVGLKNKLGAIAETIGEKTGKIKEGERTKTMKLVLDSDIREFARQDARDIQDQLTGEAKYNERTLVERAKNPLGSVLGTLNDINSDFLEKEDWFFLRGHYRKALGGWMQANGYTVEQVKNDPALLEKGRQYAINEAQKATYRDFNGVAQMLNDAVRNPQTTGRKIVAFGIEATLPFKKTPANILKRGIEYSPIGIARGLYNLKANLKNGNMTPTQVIDQICSGVSGTVALTLGYLLAGTGAVSCGMGDDEDEFEKLKGGQKYSINPGKALNNLFHVNLFGEDVTYTMDWAAPMAMPFFVGAAMRDQYDSEGKFGVNDIINAMSSITEPVFNLSMLDGVNTLLKTNKYSDDDNQYTQIGAKIVSNYISSYVPSFFGAVARTIDPYSRQSYVTKGQDTGVEGTFRYAWEQMENKIPGWSFTNIPQRDVWGEEKTASWAEKIVENFISPGYIEHYESDPLIDELTRLYGYKTDKDLVPSMPPKYFKYKEVPYNLSPEQYDKYSEIRGKTAHQMLNELINSEAYQDINTTDDARIQMVKDVWNYADTVGKHAIVPEVDVESLGTMETLTADAMIASDKDNMVKMLDQGRYDEYEIYLEKLREADVPDSTIKQKISGKYMNKYKEAYRMYVQTGKEEHYNEMLRIEEILDESGFGFDYGAWQAKVDEKYGW